MTQHQIPVRRHQLELWSPGLDVQPCLALSLKGNVLFLPCLALQTMSQTCSYSFNIDHTASHQLYAVWGATIAIPSRVSRSSFRSSVQPEWQRLMILPDDSLDVDTEFFPWVGLVT